MSTPSREEILANKLLEGQLTEAEIKELNAWYVEHLEEEIAIPPDFANSDEELRKRIFHTIQSKIKEKPETKLWKRLSVAAFMLFFLSITFYFYLSNRTNHSSQEVSQSEILPGANRAMLIRTDGRKIDLGDIKSGEITEQSGVKITKNDDGQIIYDLTAIAEDNKNMGLNTIQTPAGGQFQVILPDGSHVWLNALSSLRYPIAFTGKERAVTLTGEGYFEIAHKKNQPFKVISEGQSVEVLGTSFNINAYQDEKSTKTALLEGSIRISSERFSRILKPGQQAEVNRQQTLYVTDNLKMESVLAWKNGYFMFSNEPIESVMRKIARWYDLEVVYQDDVKDKMLWGTMSRFKDISAVLKTLELTGTAHFKLSNDNGERRLIVMK